MPATSLPDDDVLCECGHDEWDHGQQGPGCWVEYCGCKQFKPLATFQQLKEAWELVGKMANRDPAHCESSVFGEARHECGGKE